MRNITLARIDDRLIHGQVVISWLAYSKATIAVVPDDKLCNDTFMQRLLKSVAPKGLEVKIDSVDNIAAWLKEDAEPNQNVFLIAKTPFEYERIIDSGVEIKEIILGNMAINANRKTLVKQCAATPDEVACFKRLLDKGVEIYYQMVTTMSRTNLRDVVK